MGASKIRGKIEDIQPELILSHCFRPIHYVTKFMGVFPVRILPDGCAEFKWLSLPVLYSLIFLVLFVSDTILFYPFLVFTFRSPKDDPVGFIAEMAFTVGQFASAFLTLLLVPYMSPRLAGFWNQLQRVIVLLGREGAVKGFRRVWLIARLAVAIWLFSVLFYCLMTWFYFEEYLLPYLGRDDGWEVYWAGAGFNVTFGVLITTHNLHAMTFVTFLAGIRECLNGLRKLVAGTKSPKAEKLEVYLETYDELIGLGRRLSKIYGVYLVGEVLSLLVIMVATLYNCINNTGAEMDMDTLASFSGFLAYAFWLLVISNAGEFLQESANKCRKVLIKAGKGLDRQGSYLFLPIVCNEPAYVTACGYFNINRALLTAVFGAITTYLIVLMQFKFTTDEGMEGNLTSTGTTMTL